MSERATQLGLTFRPKPYPHTIEEGFLRFHHANPCVYQTLVRLARHARDKGVERIGIGMLWERMRWDLSVETGSGREDFKLNNNYRSRYARLLMEREPDLRDLFETRELKAS